MSIINAFGKQFDGGDLTISLLGNQPVNFKKFTYEKTVESQANNGRGNKVIGYSKGKESFTAELELGMNEWRGIINASPGGNPTKIKPFQIVATYANDDNEIVVDIATVIITGYNGGSGVEDMNVMVTPKLLCLGVQTGVKI